MRTRRYLLQKIGQLVLTMVFVLLFNFFLFRVMPGNPVTLLARAEGAKLSAAAQKALIHDLGLDRPMLGQFATYVSNTVRGNFGESLFVLPGQSVGSVFLEFLTPTLLLVGISTLLSTVFGLLMGIYGGWRRGSAFDLSSMGFSLVLYSMPEFWLGILLLIFLGGRLHLFPVNGYSSVRTTYLGIAHVVDVINHLFLPCLTLTLAYLGEYYLLMRSSLLDVLGEEYITLARAKGLSEDSVLWRHAVRNALLPTVTLIALNFGFVIGGAITVETVFSYPGLGYLTFRAIQSKDFPLLQGMFLFFSLAVIVANFVADLLYAYLDPRVRAA
jgi:peptide/nickel transport system permease protein